MRIVEDRDVLLPLSVTGGVLAVDDAAASTATVAAPGSGGGPAPARARSRRGRGLLGPAEVEHRTAARRRPGRWGGRRWGGSRRGRRRCGTRRRGRTGTSRRRGGSGLRPAVGARLWLRLRVRGRLWVGPGRRGGGGRRWVGRGRQEFGDCPPRGGRRDAPEVVGHHPRPRHGRLA